MARYSVELESHMETPREIKLDWKVYSFNELDEKASGNEGLLKNTSGVYLWIIQTNPPRVKYIGQTCDSFFNRTLKHIQMYLSGMYTVFGKIDYSQDFLHYLRDNILGENLRDLLHKKFLLNAPPPSTISSIVNAENILSYIEYFSKFKYAFAPLYKKSDNTTTKEESDARINLARQIEGALIIKLNAEYRLFTNNKELIFSGQRRNDTILGRIPVNPKHNFNFVHTPTPGIPDEVLNIAGYHIEQ
jgi:hypothetical protein